MQDGMAKALSLPEGLPIARFRPRPAVEMPAGVSEIPLIDAKTPKNKQVEEHWVAHVRVFNLSDDEEREEYTRIWQQITDGLARMCEHRTEFEVDKCAFVALLRWAELKYKVPST